MSNTRKRKKSGHSANVFRHKLTFAALIITALAAAALFVLDRTGGLYLQRLENKAGA